MQTHATPDKPADPRSILEVCAFCPNPCRRAWPAELAPPLEGALPSGMSLLAVAVAEGRIEVDASVRAALVPGPGTLACIAVCSYGLDVAAALHGVVR